MKKMNKKVLIIISCIIIGIVIIILINNKFLNNKNLLWECNSIVEDNINTTIKVSKNETGIVYQMIFEKSIIDYSSEQKELLDIFINNSLSRYQNINGLTYNKDINDNTLVVELVVNQELVKDDVNFNELFGFWSEDNNDIKNRLESGGFKCVEY